MLELININKNYNPGSVNELCLFRDFNLTVKDGEFVSVVGSNGSGKTSMLNIICGSIAVDSGKILIHGEDITRQKDYIRQRRIGRVYQDPSKGTCPGMTILENMSIAENKGKPYNLGRGVNKAKLEEYREMLRPLNLGLEDKMGVQVGSLSGGQRQRIVIARALILDPQFIFCDEPVSALDVSVRAQVLNLMKDLQKEFNLTYMFISHDLSVVRFLCDRIAVMYLGRIVELADKEELYNNAKHPYTEALMSAIPVPDVDVKRIPVLLEGDIPSPYNPPSGCLFHTRCRYATERCKTEVPQMMEVCPGHQVACHLFAENGGGKV